MCGIAGILNLDRRETDGAQLKKMADALAHRGPDGVGFFARENVGLVHTRLSIIDLESGKQPLTNENGSVWITFNGEIYNYGELRQRLTGLGHHFRTDSDTETIVHAYEQWGTGCLDHLRGMFAFAIWDANTSSLFLARDRIGIKPLVYFRASSQIAFASELQSLRTLETFPSNINLAAIDQFLHFQYIPAPLTAFSEVSKLEPAHFIVFDRDGTTAGPQRYWKLHFEPDYSLNEDQWVERLEQCLLETVSQHLVADVPFGAFLSGGIDSSLVVAAMSDILKEPARTFCIGHADDEFDERGWARMAAKICHADFAERTIHEASLELIPKLVRHFGEPFADSSALPTSLVSEFARENVKMVLSGDGGDELFAGYYGYSAVLWDHDRALTRAGQARHMIGNMLRQIRIRPPLKSATESKYERTTPMCANKRRMLWRPEFHGLIDGTKQDFEDRFRSAKQSNLLNTLQAFDVENYIPFDNLAKVDIASMSHGLEVRVPLLDHVFVEAVCKLPPAFKLTGLDHREKLSIPPATVSNKWLWKKVAAERFGSEFVRRQKKGFEIPIQHWLNGLVASRTRDQILGTSVLSDWFNRSVVEDVISSAGDSKQNAWNCWSLAILSEWCNQQSVN